MQYSALCHEDLSHEATHSETKTSTGTLTQHTGQCILGLATTPGQGRCLATLHGLCTVKVAAEREMSGEIKRAERHTLTDHQRANTDKPGPRYTRQPPPLPNVATAAEPLASHKTEPTVDERAAFSLLLLILVIWVRKLQLFTLFFTLQIATEQRQYALYSI